MYKTPLAVCATIVLALSLTGCGNSKGGGNGPSSNSTSSAPRAFDTGQFAKIQDCLKAAGLAPDLPTDRPSGFPSGIPSDLPTDASGRPTGRPTGGPPGGFGQLNDPQVQDALKACGLTLPQGRGNPPGS